MKIVPLFVLTILVGLAATAPVADDENVVVTRKFFQDTSVIYTAEHDIVSVTVPPNALNFEYDVHDYYRPVSESKITLFFTEADVDAEGNKDYKGLYVLKNGIATKLLEHGTDTAAANDHSKTAYFGAKDGLYFYNPIENKAEKYGTVTDSIINLEKENGTDVIYILTEDHHLYKVTDNGNKKVKIDDVKDAQEIVLDSSNNLYYHGADKQPYVLTTDGVKKIEGLPANPTYVNLVKPTFVNEDRVFFFSDQNLYSIYANGNSDLVESEFHHVKPTAYTAEAILYHYYAYNKKLYEINLFKKFLNGIPDLLKDIFAKPRWN